MPKKVKIKKIHKIVNDYRETIEKMDEIIELAKTKKMQAYEIFHNGIKESLSNKGSLELLKELIDENEKRKKAKAGRMENRKEKSI